ANCNANADANCNADADANCNADADANCNADANADADANAGKDRLGAEQDDLEPDSGRRVCAEHRVRDGIGR
ncbi:hypothetical protein, partial [Halococcus agarilyticus]|uniref:hypothetical protein n=1 Tax=Halococcus agarilyticus TaxID=1232219 RepID=UPI0007A4206D